MKIRILNSGRHLAAFCVASCLASTILGQTAPAVPADSQQESIVTLSPFEVKQDQDVGYGSAYSTGGTRMNVKFTESPIPVISVNRQLLDDMSVTDAYDVLQYIGGTNKTHAPQQHGFALRGAGSSQPVFNGLASPGVSESNINEYEFVDRIEVIKGPTGTLYGSHSVGGLVNFVTKRPLPVRKTTVTATYETDGPDGFIRGTLDTTGPLGKSEKLRYRFVGVYAEGTFYNGGVRDRQGAYGIVTYDFDTTMSVWANVSSLYINEIGIDSGWFMDKEGNVSTFLGADYNTFRNNDDQVFKHQNWKNNYEVGLEKRFDAGPVQLASRVLARYYSNDFSRYASAVNGNLSFYDAAGNLLGTNFGPVAAQIVLTNPAIARITRTNPSFADLINPEKGWGFYTDTLAKFEIGPTKHDTLLYLQHLGGTTDTTTRRRIFAFEETGTRTAEVWPRAAGPALIDFTTLDTAGYPATYPGSPWVGMNERRNTTRDSLAFGVQESMKLLNDRVIVVGGARYDWSRTTTINYLTSGQHPFANKNNNWTTTYGLVYKPIRDREVSLFYNAGETFAPTGGGLDSLGQLIPNRVTSGSEFGTKLEAFGGRLITTASIFKYDTSPFLQTVNIINPDGTFFGGSVLGGKQVIKGWDVDTAFTVFRNFSVIGAVGEYEAKLQNGTITNNSPIGVMYRGFAKYDFSSGALKGLALGVGYSQTPDRYVDATNTLKMAAYDTVQLMSSYRINRHWLVQMNVYNLFDKEYSASSASNRAFITPGRSRQFGFTTRYNF